ncbi:hypothetical protein ACQKMD_21235 [Viridibacillus sp. NPDC096237]|uniref:hypothetical protein n=1 Tax=Viridibacillus sp. NPDC096237 TaxID=3390721 RepID=UPI003CFF154D
MKKFNATFFLLLCSILIMGLPVSAQELKPTNVVSFHGESENWVASFSTDLLEGGITTEGNLKYKGKDVDSVGQVSCTYETSAGGLAMFSLLAGTSIGSPVGEKGTLSTKGLGGNVNLYSKIEVVKVTVKWDGKTELFNLYK